MIAYLIRRALWGVALLLVISFATFVIFFVIPPDRAQVGRGLGSVDLSLRDSVGVRQGPVPAQWAEYVWNAVRHASLGTTFRGEEPVTTIVARAIPVTASLIVGGTILFLLMSIPIGILSALRPRSLFDRLAMLVVLIGVSAHPAWIGLVLAYFFGFKWHITPIGEYCDFFTPVVGCGGPVQWAYHLLLPWFTFAILFAALYARMIRASVLESLHEDYVRTALAKGASRMHVMRHHVLRNAALPVVTMLGMDVGLAFAGSVFIESVFSLPGMGRVLLRALTQRDLPIILGVMLVVTSAIVVFNLMVDLLYAVLDPRVRATQNSHDFGDAPAPPRRAPHRQIATESAS